MSNIKQQPAWFQIFQEIGAVQSLKRIVMYSSNGTACSLAKRALRMMEEEVPKRILSNVPNWKTCEVQTWLQQVGFSAFCDCFQVSFDFPVLKKLTLLSSNITRMRLINLCLPDEPGAPGGWRSPFEHHRARAEHRPGHDCWPLPQEASYSTELKQKPTCFTPNTLIDAK